MQKQLIIELIEMKNVIQVAKIIAKSKYLVAFTGAGISTESGLSDYRGPDGVWTRRDKGLLPKPDPRINDVRPNPGHKVLVDFYKSGILKFLISQNVDNLHRKSGIPLDILAELHGNHSLMKCLNCDKRFEKDDIGWDNQVFGNGYRTSPQIPGQPTCPHCEGRIISSIVNFNDPMPEQEMKKASYHSEQCDVMLVIGSSLSVYPATDMPKIAKENGAVVIIINQGPTELDHIADIRIEGKAGEFLFTIAEEVNTLISQ